MRLHAARGYSLGAVGLSVQPVPAGDSPDQRSGASWSWRGCTRRRAGTPRRVALATEQGGSRRRGGDGSSAGRAGRSHPRADRGPIEKRLDRRRSAPAVLPYMADLAGRARPDRRDPIAEAEGSGSASMPTVGSPRRRPESPRTREILDAALRVIVSPEARRPCPARTAPGRGRSWRRCPPAGRRSAPIRASPCSIRAAATPRADIELGPRPGRAAPPSPLDNRSLYREIEERDRRKDEFLAMLAHELRNPLAAISNAAAVLEKLGHQDDDTARIRMIIGRQTHHLARPG